MVNFKEIYHFSKVPEGVQLYQVGGVQLFPGEGPFFSRGSNCLFPIETHITCDFPGGGGGLDPLSPPLDPHLFRMSCFCYRSLSFGAVGLSLVCDCGISWGHSRFLFNVPNFAFSY